MFVKILILFITEFDKTDFLCLVFSHIYYYYCISYNNSNKDKITGPQPVL